MCVERPRFLAPAGGLLEPLEGGRRVALVVGAEAPRRPFDRRQLQQQAAPDAGVGASALASAAGASAAGAGGAAFLAPGRLAPAAIPNPFTWAAGAELVTSVCTGSALLAAAGLLDGYRATSNKRAFAWAREQGPRVQWVAQARWVADRDRWIDQANYLAKDDIAGFEATFGKL